MHFFKTVKRCKWLTLQRQNIFSRAGESWNVLYFIKNTYNVIQDSQCTKCTIGKKSYQNLQRCVFTKELLLCSHSYIHWGALYIKVSRVVKWRAKYFSTVCWYCTGAWYTSAKRFDQKSGILFKRINMTHDAITSKLRERKYTPPCWFFFLSIVYSKCYECVTSFWHSVLATLYSYCLWW